MKEFPPSVIEDGTFWAYSLSKYFVIKFSSKAIFLTALDYLKVRNAPFHFEDEIDGNTKDIWVRKNKPLYQIKMGQFNSHFYTGVSTMFKDTQHADKKLKYVHGELFVEVKGDIMLLLSLEEAPGDEQFNVHPSYKNFEKMGFSATTVDTMVTLALASARKQ